MVGAVEQGHFQHYLLNIWAHLAGSWSTRKLKEVIIAFLNEILPAARTHLILSEKIFWDGNFMGSSEEPRLVLCDCELLIFLWEVTSLQNTAIFPWGKEGGGHNQEILKVSPVLLVFVRLTFILYIGCAEVMSAGLGSLGRSAVLGERAYRHLLDKPDSPPSDRMENFNATECGKISSSAQKKGCFWVNSQGWLGQSEVNTCIFPTVFNRNDESQHEVLQKPPLNTCWYDTHQQAVEVGQPWCPILPSKQLCFAHQHSSPGQRTSVWVQGTKLRRSPQKQQWG